MTEDADTQRTRQALRAAGKVAGQLTRSPDEPVFLHRSQHISVLLPSMETVARIVPATGNHRVERLRRELSVAGYLAERGAPVVPPSRRYPAGPHFQDGFAMTLWPYVEHDATDCENDVHLAKAAAALRKVHDLFADYPHALPRYDAKIRECRAQLADLSTLPALAAIDRAFLADTHDRLSASLASFTIDAVPIHGDAQPGNVFMTADGALWADFEAASLGPREWDLCWLPRPDSTEPIDHDLLVILKDLHSVCVSVWCWALSHIPEKREAAEYHLDRLKTRHAA